MRAERRNLGRLLCGNVEQEIYTGLLIHSGRRWVVPRQHGWSPQDALHTMWVALGPMPTRIGCGADRISRESRDGNMISVTVPAVRIIGDHQVRPMTAHDGHELRANLARGRIGQMLVAIPEHVDLADAQQGGCVPQLCLAQRRQLVGRT